MCIRVLAATLAIATMFLVAATSARAVTRIPGRCLTRPAQRLCAIHFHKTRADHARRLMGLHPYQYHWVAERYPARRGRILASWVRTQRLAQKELARYRHAQQLAPWLHGTWHQDALCVHHYEGAWNAATGNGYYGGMQFDLGTWQSNGGVGMPNQASPAEQLRIAYRTWQGRGWSPWPNTAAMCGLL